MHFSCSDCVQQHKISLLPIVVADMDRNLEPFGSIRPQVAEGEEHVVENLEKEAIFQGEKQSNSP